MHITVIEILYIQILKVDVLAPLNKQVSNLNKRKGSKDFFWSIWKTITGEMIKTKFQKLLVPTCIVLLTGESQGKIRPKWSQLTYGSTVSLSAN